MFFIGGGGGTTRMTLSERVYLFDTYFEWAYDITQRTRQL